MGHSEKWILVLNSWENHCGFESRWEHLREKQAVVVVVIVILFRAGAHRDVTRSPGSWDRDAMWHLEKPVLEVSLPLGPYMVNTLY